MAAKTMYEKIWAAHQIADEGGEILLYVDRAYIHEGSSHAFAALDERGQKVMRPRQVSPTPIITCRPRRAPAVSKASRFPKSATW